MDSRRDHAALEGGALLLTTRGRRSGRERTVVLQFFPDGNAMVVAAANGGDQPRATMPAWQWRWRYPADTGAPATTSDALRRLTALGRTRSDRALLGHALGELDAQHRLASGIAAEPNLAAIMTEFVTRLMDAFGSLAAIRGQAVLDIACGSSSSRSPVTGRPTSEFEPWMCRLLTELGARPVGLDIGDISDEAFEYHRVDLGVPGALDFLATESFDAIHESRLFGSPEFRSAHGPATQRIRREIHRQERRLMRPDGTLI